MQIKEIIAELGVKESTAYYWQRMLRDADLINPQRAFGNKLVFSDDDLKQFKRLKDYVEAGATSYTEAIRLMKDDVSPEEALRRYQALQEESETRIQAAQRQLEVTQKKLLALRKPFWKRLRTWFRGHLWSLLSREPAED